MVALKQLRLLRQTTLPSRQSILLGGAACIMLAASILPWLKDPLGESYYAWGLPIDIGWQFRIGILSYGLLCLCCALYAFCVAYAHWRPFKGSDFFVRRNVSVGLLCIVPIALFLLQYLGSDVQGINQLAQHEIQMLLIQHHFGYNIAMERITIDPFALDTSTIPGRLEILVDQVSLGPLLPLVAALICFGRGRPKGPHPASAPLPPLRRRRNGIWLAGIGILMFVLGVVLGRAPTAIASEYQATVALEAGDYQLALNWLNAARALNPALDQVAYYHIERGQALYFLHPDQPNDESLAYLAFEYQERGDDLDAYQQLLTIAQAHQPPAWVVDEMSLTLEKLAEFTHSLKGAPIPRSDNDVTALPWVQLLAQVDPSNVYAQYFVGRLQYDLHNYTGCTEQMLKVIALSPNRDVQSSAYTYMALSSAGQGDYLQERALLFKAIQLDPNYYNNTAREELSGLH